MEEACHLFSCLTQDLTHVLSVHIPLVGLGTGPCLDTGVGGAGGGGCSPAGQLLPLATLGSGKGAQILLGQLSVFATHAFAFLCTTPSEAIFCSGSLA